MADFLCRLALGGQKLRQWSCKRGCPIVWKGQPRKSIYWQAELTAPGVPKSPVE